MLKSRIVILFLFICEICNAQQEPIFTMFWNNYSIYNPAATGVHNKIYAASTSRAQWTSFDSAPKTQSVLFDYRIDKLNSGIGVNYTYDQIGFSKSNKINLNYAYHIKFKKDRSLVSGIAAGYEKMKFEFSSLVAVTPNNPLILASEDNSFFNVNAGLLYKSPHFIIGLSSTQINEAKGLIYTKSRHYFAQVIANYNITQRIEIKPAVFYRSDAVSSLLEGNIRIAYDKKYWAGLTYRVQNSLCFMAGVDLKEKFRISYSYDFYDSPLTNFGPTHELGFALMLN